MTRPLVIDGNEVVELPGSSAAAMVAAVDSGRYTSSLAASVSPSWGEILFYSNSGGTINLPTASGNAGKTLEIWVLGAAGATLDPNSSETINGAATYAAEQYQVLKVASDGTNVFVQKKTEAGGSYLEFFAEVEDSTDLTINEDGLYLIALNSRTANQYIRVDSTNVLRPSDETTFCFCIERGGSDIVVDLEPTPYSVADGIITAYKVLDDRIIGSITAWNTTSAQTLELEDGEYIAHVTVGHVFSAIYTTTVKIGATTLATLSVSGNQLPASRYWPIRFSVSSGPLDLSLTNDNANAGAMCYVEKIS